MMNQRNGFAGGRLVAVLALAVGVLSTSACATITYDASMVQSVVALNRTAPVGAYERVGSFEISQRPVFVIAQLITVVDAELEDALGRELQRSGGDAILNLRIHEEYDIIDFAVAAAQSILLFGANIVQTRSVSLQGDVVRWNTGFLETDEGRLWLAENCRATEVEGQSGARVAHLCVAPEAENIELGLAN